jgi:hypothetical protein
MLHGVFPHSARAYLSVDPFCFETLRPTWMHERSDSTFHAALPHNYTRATIHFGLTRVHVSTSTYQQQPYSVPTFPSSDRA